MGIRRYLLTIENAGANVVLSCVTESTIYERSIIMNNRKHAL